MTFKSGFVNIFGYPNAGKSTLMNKLVGEKISIVTPKVQTTRQRIRGILSGEQFQIVFSDTPGILQPRYEMHKAMQKEIEFALQDADIVLYLTEPDDNTDKHLSFIERIKKRNLPTLLLINKIDLSSQEKVQAKISEWKNHFPEENIIPISALYNHNLSYLIQKIKELLPEHPPYFDTDQLTDKSEKYLASEIIREKIFLRFKEEIPYHTEVVVKRFEDTPQLLSIFADIYVNKRSQKPILIGKNGQALKEIGILAREELESFFGKKIYLELYVKVRENWRDKKLYLRQFGFDI